MFDTMSLVAHLHNQVVQAIGGFVLSDNRCYERCKAGGRVSLNGGRHEVGAVGVFEEKLDPVAGCPIFLPRVEDDGVGVPSVERGK
jgi:hypothetical protein